MFVFLLTPLHVIIFQFHPSHSKSHDFISHLYKCLWHVIDERNYAETVPFLPYIQRIYGLGEGPERDVLGRMWTRTVWDAGWPSPTPSLCGDTLFDTAIGELSMWRYGVLVSVWIRATALCASGGLDFKPLGKRLNCWGWAGLRVVGLVKPEARTHAEGPLHQVNKQKLQSRSDTQRTAFWRYQIFSLGSYFYLFHNHRHGINDLSP